MEMRANDSVWKSAARQPLFAFFTGEAWNQMGSHSFFRDLVSFECDQVATKGDGCAHPYQK